jgi:hypothetical protein
MQIALNAARGSQEVDDPDLPRGGGAGKSQSKSKAKRETRANAKKGRKNAD